MNSFVGQDSDPGFISEFSNSLLEEFYLRDGETVAEAFWRTSYAFSFNDIELAKRIHTAAMNGWFMFSSPVLSNAPKGHWTFDGTKPDDIPMGRRGPSDEALWKMKSEASYKHWNSRERDECLTGSFVGEVNDAMPISCFALTIPDTIEGQIDAMKELAALSVSGGGVGLHNQIRAVSKKAPGPIPFEKVADGAIGYFKQSSVRRGACAYYLDVDHPDIVEHINFRMPTGGDRKRRADNLTQFHSGVNITDEFIQAVLDDADFDLRCPHSGEVKETVKARSIWELILDVRSFTGEPYIAKIDTANRALPQTQKDLGLRINGSNICSEIFLPTDDERTMVCCLSSLNLEKYDEWKDKGLVADLVTFLDNVIQYFIELAPESLEKAKFSAYRERAIGIGAMGWHRFLQSKGIPFEGGGFNSAINYTHRIFKDIKEQAEAQSLKLGAERGEAPDMIGTGRRNSHLLAIAPNSNSGIILGTSPSIEPEAGMAYLQNTRAGTFMVRNPYFAEVLDKYASNAGVSDDWIEAQWKSVVDNGGSVQHLEYLSDEERGLFKTAYELDQHWLVEQADARQQYVCQGQSLNLFFPHGVDKAYYNSVHLKALRSEYVKSLYYSRMRRAETATVRRVEVATLQDWKPTDNEDDCIACQG